MFRAVQFPVHLACSGQVDIDSDGSKNDTNINAHEEDLRRKECVRLLLEEGNVPLTMKNSAKQTVLHAAARGGYCEVLKYLMELWKNDDSIRVIKSWGTKFDYNGSLFPACVCHSQPILLYFHSHMMRLHTSHI